jgi:hypothetical protein
MIKVPEKLVALADEGADEAYNFNNDPNAESILQSDVRALLTSIKDEQAKDANSLEEIKNNISVVITNLTSHNAG